MQLTLVHTISNRYNSFMANISNRLPALIFCCLILTALPLPAAIPRKSETDLIQMLYSRDAIKINDALDRLPAWYPHSTNAMDAIRGLLITNQMVILIPRQHIAIKNSTYLTNSWTIVSAPTNFLARATARALGEYHAPVGDAELQQIYRLLKIPDVDTKSDALKSLRDLDAPQSIPEILPLLQDENHHVLRDACRTLAVLGDKSTIPYLEPLLKNSRSDVRSEAQLAIKTLQSKS
jgi:hypothetical protein